MADNPLATLARIAGGLILLDGNLGHQVLGQLLIMNTNEVAMAGAAAVMAGTTGQRSAVGQIVLRTFVPAVAVRLILDKQEQRIDRKALILEERERALAKHTRRLRRKHRRMDHDLNRLGNTVNATRPTRGSRRGSRDDDV